MRLAPSATNRQPWFFTGTADEIRCYRAKVVGNPLLRLMLGDVQYLDDGIALCHLRLASFAQHKTLAFYEEAAVPSLDTNYDYVCTARLRTETQEENL